MQLTSTAFTQGQPIPSTYSCDGRNVNPPLTISDVPTSAQSLALIMDDPDVPAAAGVKVWDHWVVFNLSPTLTSIGENEQPPGVRGKGTRGSLSYGGPCPPDREHRYFFKLYALDAMLDLKEGATKADLESAMSGHVIEQAELMGTYVRK
ncbi:kinase inhibitor [Candidatus Uhrbacteria bacterium RIFCSPHIGHO2_12_FULL_60_25]|uniref:Kinase inhibitor n=1 Tax=Candidatus Uhrbacteria bacterium RIFCSPHIGHO2_12_FULL_60_25 TaxID=1802399 RepID=A0A1F7UK25_9BACT|nr:MAG: kinase inhibitor [Candidatus Uhrbacteria bacterium RIFCSPHIGHO2_02_FULL_60_44]OGL78636.1 MAG: kinase inhibitor [Candidatus Uhrbacteria bacterium RIFCSPHIGHO2_12_FULL_60_25]